MKIQDFVFNKVLGPYMQRRIDEKVEAMKESIIPADAGREEDVGWRRLTEAKRDLPIYKQEKMQEIAFFMYDRNGMAHRFIEMMKDFVVGEGITFDAEDSGVKEVLTKFWKDPINLWDLKQQDKIKELGIFGEQAYPTFVNNVDGHVRLGYLDPSRIEKIETNPENIEDIVAIKTKDFGDGTEGKTLKVVRINDDTNSDNYGLWEGEIFYFTVNKVTTSTRGRSDLFYLADWIDAYEKFLFARAERAELLNAWIYDVELQGMNETQISEWMGKQKKPRPGSFRAHNEKVKWNAVSPNLEANDASKEANTFRNHILAQAGYPPHYFSGGEGITRATALEMATPVFKMFKSRQKYYKYIVSHIFRYVIDQAVIAGKLKKDVNKNFTINMPKLTEKSIEQISNALFTTTNSLAIGQENNWISNEDAGKVFRHMISQIGIDVSDVDQDELDEAIEKYEKTQSKLKEAIEEIKRLKNANK